MIKSKENYQYYLEADKIALGMRESWIDLHYYDIWRFERLLSRVRSFSDYEKSSTIFEGFCQ